MAVWEAGQGHPLLVLHGLGLDHVGLSELLEERFDEESSWRRIYIDLPGMGKTRGTEHLTSADSLLSVVAAVVEAQIGDDRFAILGRSYGVYLALGTMRDFQERLSGLALLIPVVEPARERRILPRPIKLRTDNEAFAALPGAFLEDFRELMVEEPPALASATHARRRRPSRPAGEAGTHRSSDRRLAGEGESPGGPLIECSNRGGRSPRDFPGSPTR